MRKVEDKEMVVREENVRVGDFGGEGILSYEKIIVEFNYVGWCN